VGVGCAAVVESRSEQHPAVWIWD